MNQKLDLPDEMCTVMAESCISDRHPVAVLSRFL